MMLNLISLVMIAATVPPSMGAVFNPAITQVEVIEQISCLSPNKGENTIARITQLANYFFAMTPNDSPNNFEDFLKTFTGDNLRISKMEFVERAVALGFADTKEIFDLSLIQAELELAKYSEDDVEFTLKKVTKALEKFKLEIYDPDKEFETQFKTVSSSFEKPQGAFSDEIVTPNNKKPHKDQKYFRTNAKDGLVDLENIVINEWIINEETARLVLNHLERMVPSNSLGNLSPADRNRLELTLNRIWVQLEATFFNMRSNLSSLSKLYPQFPMEGISSENRQIEGRKLFLTALKERSSLQEIVSKLLNYKAVFVPKDLSWLNLLRTKYDWFFSLYGG